MKISNVDQATIVSGTKEVQARPQVIKNNSTKVTESSSDKSLKFSNEKAELPKDKSINEDLLKKSVEQANKNLVQHNRYIERSVHEDTQAIMYVIKDSSTDEVIGEFPPKKIQDMIAKMWELAGLFVDEEA